MKKLILTTSLFLSTFGFAQTHNQDIATKLVTVLQSPEIQEILKKSQDENGGRHNYFQEIKYVRSYRAKFGPSEFELTFQSFGKAEGDVKFCNVSAFLNHETNEVSSENNCK